MPEQSIPRNTNEGTAPAGFSGFALPTSNTTYTPNQFFDVCLPHSSRGCVRLVSVMIRKTLGWCDEHGRPQHEQIRLSYADFQAAGIGRAMIKPAVAEAIKRRFIRCVREPAAKTPGQTSVTALYELNWDESAEYVKDPARFRGFFAGDGNRTYIPNQFFDHVVTTESLAMVKVVGAVVRFSIGFANKWGHRRMLASLSYLHIQRYTKLRDRKSLAAALRIAIRNNYINRVEAGYFDPRGGVHSRKAIYALKWLSTATDQTIGSKTPPEETIAKKTVQNPYRDRFEIPTGDRFGNPTGLQIKQNKTSKQQQDAASLEKGRAGSNATAVQLLATEGFNALTAQKLTTNYPIEQIIRQIDWIDARGVKRNRLGMLRLAIEQDWAKPGSEKLRRRNSSADEHDELQQARARLNEHFNQIQP
jgi:hypothetical protein